MYFYEILSCSLVLITHVYEYQPYGYQSIINSELSESSWVAELGCCVVGCELASWAVWTVAERFCGFCLSAFGDDVCTQIEEGHDADSQANHSPCHGCTRANFISASTSTWARMLPRVARPYDYEYRTTLFIFLFFARGRFHLFREIWDNLALYLAKQLLFW